MKELKVGDKVFYTDKYRNLEITEIVVPNRLVKIKGEVEVNKPYSSEKVWKTMEREVPVSMLFCISKENHKNINNTIYKKPIYYDLIEKRQLDIPFYTLYENIVKERIDMHPIYQRDFVWTIEQKQHYLENLFNGKIPYINPTLICVGYEEDKYEKNKCVFKYELLDGKQRINTLIEFFEGNISLRNGTYFHDLSLKDKITFYNTNVKYTEYISRKSDDVFTLKLKIDLFLEINELGTKMSDEHIQKVKGLINE